MRYAGGKEKIANPITQQLLALRRPEHDTYLEPFCGGCNILSIMAPHFPRVIAADISPDLILMWQALQTGWKPPTTMTEPEYEALRFAEPSALRGFAGFGCSFGGKWFAGFVGQKNLKIVDATSRAVVRQSQTMQAVKFHCTDYRTLTQVGPRCLIYCDPPYYSTTGYGSGARHFDSSEFWHHIQHRIHIEKISEGVDPYRLKGDKIRAAGHGLKIGIFQRRPPAFVIRNLSYQS